MFKNTESLKHQFFSAVVIADFKKLLTKQPSSRCVGHRIAGLSGDPCGFLDICNGLAVATELLQGQSVVVKSSVCSVCQTNFPRNFNRAFEKYFCTHVIAFVKARNSADFDQCHAGQPIKVGALEQLGSEGKGALGLTQLNHRRGDASPHVRRTGCLQIGMRFPQCERPAIIAEHHTTVDPYTQTSDAVPIFKRQALENLVYLFSAPLLCLQ